MPLGLGGKGSSTPSMPPSRFTIENPAAAIAPGTQEPLPPSAEIQRRSVEMDGLFDALPFSFAMFAGAVVQKQMASVSPIGDVAGWFISICPGEAVLPVRLQPALLSKEHKIDRLYASHVAPPDRHRLPDPGPPIYFLRFSRNQLASFSAQGRALSLKEEEFPCTGVVRPPHNCGAPRLSMTVTSRKRSHDAFQW